LVRMKLNEIWKMKFRFLGYTSSNIGI
jgi:hypothetical protein